MPISSGRSPVNPSAALGIPVVYLVDDEDVVRDALAWLLRSRRLLSQGYASADAFESFLHEQQAPGRAPWPQAPACLVLDVRMPGTSGIVLFERLAQRGLLPLLPVIFLTGHGDVPTAVAAVKRGAFDFVEKPFSNNGLVDRVELALRSSGQALLQQRAQEGHRRALAELTERERDVLRLVVDGKPNKAIADELQISVRTVEVHRARVFDKMNVKSAVALANLLREEHAPRPAEPAVPREDLSRPAKPDPVRSAPRPAEPAVPGGDLSRPAKPDLLRRPG